MAAVGAEAAGGCGAGAWLRSAGLALWARIAWAAMSRAAPAVVQMGGCALEDAKMRSLKAKNIGCRGHNRDTHALHSSDAVRHAPLHPTSLQDALLSPHTKDCIQYHRKWRLHWAAFYEPAMDVRWQSLPGLMPLIKCLPESCWVVDASGWIAKT